jgi:hypothetical protein
MKTPTAFLLLSPLVICKKCCVVVVNVDILVGMLQGWGMMETFPTTAHCSSSSHLNRAETRPPETPPLLIDRRLGRRHCNWRSSGSDRHCVATLPPLSPTVHTYSKYASVSLNISSSASYSMVTCFSSCSCPRLSFFPLLFPWSLITSSPYFQILILMPSHISISPPLIVLALSRTGSLQAYSAPPPPPIFDSSYSLFSLFQFQSLAIFGSSVLSVPTVFLSSLIPDSPHSWLCRHVSFLFVSFWFLFCLFSVSSFTLSIPDPVSFLFCISFLFCQIYFIFPLMCLFFIFSVVCTDNLAEFTNISLAIHPGMCTVKASKKDCRSAFTNKKHSESIRSTDENIAVNGYVKMSLPRKIINHFHTASSVFMCKNL